MAACVTGRLTATTSGSYDFLIDPHGRWEAAQFEPSFLQRKRDQGFATVLGRRPVVNLDYAVVAQVPVNKEVSERMVVGLRI